MRRTPLHALVAAALVTAGSGLGVVAVAPAASAAPTFTSPCFTPTNKLESGSYTVPASGVGSVRVVLHGQRGGDQGAKGGLGSRLVAELAVSPGQTLVLGTLSGASGGAGAPMYKPGQLSAGDSGGRGGAAQFVSTLGSDGCQHVLAVAGGGGGAGAEGSGGNADAGTGATAGANGARNSQSDAGGGGGATATSGGRGGAAGSSTFGYCSDGNAGSWGGLWSNGRGGDAVGTGDVNPCYNPRDGGGGGGAGYYYGGGGGSPYALGAAAGGGGGSSYVDPSVSKVSLTASTAETPPIATPVHDTATAIGSTPNPSYAGQSVTVNTHTTVLGTGQPVGLGEVTIRNGSTVLATLPLDANGRTTVRTTDLPVGDGALSATFASVESSTVAYRASATAGSIPQKVHPCAPTPAFRDQPVNVAATTGTTATLSATVSVSPIFEGVPTVRWQTSADNGSTWTDATGTSSVTTTNVAAGSARASLAYAVTGGPRVLRYRAIATTCGGSVTSSTPTLTVRAIDLDLTGLPAKSYGAAPFDVASYASRSTVPVAFSSATPGTCAVAGSTVTVKAVGTCTLTATESGSNGFTAAPQVQRSFAVGKKAITVTAVATPLSQPQGTASAPTVSCSPSGFVGSDGFVTPPTGGLVVLIRLPDGSQATRPHTVTAGSLRSGPQTSYKVRCSGGDPGSSYVIGQYVEGPFTITAPLPPALKITATSPRYTYGGTPPALGATYSATGATLSGTLTCRAYAVTDPTFATPLTLSDRTPAGSYTTRCSGQSSSSHTVSYATGTLTVDPAKVSVTAGSPATQAHGDTAAPEVTCSATGFLGGDGFVTAPTGAVHDAAGTEKVSVGPGTPVGSYATRCSGGDVGSNYTISERTPGTFVVADRSGPVVTVPADVDAAATSDAGAEVSFLVSATDAVDGVTDVACDPVSGSSFAIGATRVTCSSTDAAGNRGENAFTVTVQDTTAPVLDVPEDRVAEATSHDGAAVGFAASATDAVDGPTEVGCDPEPGGTFALGATTVTCSSTDAAGNRGEKSFTVTVQDTTAPETSLTETPRGPTRQTDATLGFTGRDAVGVTGYECRLDDAAAYAPCSGPQRLDELSEGSHTFRVRALDAAGNVDPTPEGVTWVVDRTAPVVAAPADRTVEATSATGAGTTFDASAEDAVDGDTGTRCDPVSGSTFALGSTRVTCEATDRAGNTGAATFAVTVSDTTAPDTTITGSLPASRTNRTGAGFGLAGTDAVGVTGFECRLDGGGFTACDGPVTYSGLEQGSHTFEVRARDAAGNLDASPATVTWVVDTTAPVVSVPPKVVVDATSPTGATADFAITATDAFPTSPAVACIRASGSSFAVGDTRVTCSATDAAGNTGSAAFVVTVTGAATQLGDLAVTIQKLVTADQGTSKNLVSILQNARAAATRGDTRAACDKLASFASQVRAQAGKKVTTVTAAALLVGAQRIGRVLGCS